MTLSPCLKTLPGIYDAISFLRGESPEEQRQRFFKASFPCPDQPPPDHPYWQEADEPEDPPSPAGPQAHLFAGFLKDPAFTTGQAPIPDHITGGWQAPMGADCLTVLLMLQLAQAHQNAAEPAERLRDPGHILVIRVPGLDLIEPVQRAASFLWRSILKAEQIWSQPPADASQLVKADAERELVEIILTGKSAVAILDRTSTLPQPLRPFILSEILLPLSDRATMAATLALTHSISGPERARAFDQREIDALPEDTLLGKMSGLQLGVALGQNTLSKIIDRLHTFAASPLPGSGKKYPQLRDVYGQAEAKSFCAALIRDLDLWQKGQLDWRDVTAAALFYGPPGTGKSMLPQALANSAGLQLIRTSYAEAQQAGHQGQMLKSLMMTFTTAINQAPSILFIDELDAFYRRDHESGSLGGYNVGVVTGLLTEIDRARATPGLILIAATNHPDHVDPAVIRPGRFDLHFQISTLNRAEISALIQSSINVPSEDDAQFNLLLEQLIGATGAEIQNILRQAAARGRDQAAENVLANLVAIAGKMKPAPDPQLMFRCAIHEAGHLIVGHLLNCPAPIFARLTSDGGEIISKPRRTHTNDTIAADLTCLMAGRAAEIIVFGAASSGGGTTSASDLAKASSMALAAEVQWGFGEGPTPLWQPVNDPATFWRLGGEAKAAAQRRIALAEANARQLLSGRQVDLEVLARLLIKHRELDQAGLEKALQTVI